MNAFSRFLATVAILVLTATQGGLARTPLSDLVVEAPPLPGNAAASALFDAMIAIGRAKATYPAGAQHAAIPYAAGLARFRAGDFPAAEQDALQAIGLTSRTPYPQPKAWTSPSPTIASVVPMPALVETPQADAEAALGFARRSLGRCPVSDAALRQALQQRYAAAVNENLMHRYADVLADAQTIVAACVVRTAAAAAPSPVPSSR